MNKALKINLGAGYRLLAVLRQRMIVFTYVGSHDGCDQWLNRNRGFNLEIDLEPSCPEAPDAPDAPASGTEKFEADEQDDHDTYLYEQLDDALLRKIFKGLCGDGA